MVEEHIVRHLASEFLGLPDDAAIGNLDVCQHEYVLQSHRGVLRFSAEPRAA